MNTTKAMSFERFDPKPKRSKIIARNTFEYYNMFNHRVVRLHYTDILTFYGDNRVVFNSGGWKTPTTKNRMNDNQDQAYIYQEKSVWYIKGRSEDQAYVYFDGITFSDGVCTNPKQSTAEQKRLAKDLKQIKKYVDKIKTMDTLPLPDGGDCLYCQMGKTNELCAREHLKEMYIHGSLIQNALLWRGYTDTFLWMVFHRNEMRDQVVKCVRDYLKSRLNIAW